MKKHILILSAIFGIMGLQAQNENVYVGYQTGVAMASLDHCTFVGGQAGHANTTGYFNTFIGGRCGLANTTGHDNTFIGKVAGSSNQTGNENTYVGSYSGGGTSGVSNTSVGSRSGFTGGGSYNVNNGAYAGYNATGSYNVFDGYQAGYSSTGNGNTYSGYQSGMYNTSGTANVFMGFQSGTLQAVYNGATLIGKWADAGSNNLTNITAIGNGAMVCNSNSVVIGNSIVTSWGFGVCPAAGRAFQVGSSFSNGNGAYLSTGGAWFNTSNKDLKENITVLNPADVLRKITTLSVTRWKYKGTDNEYHIGPMAQDFYRTFQVGTDDQSISTIDPSGVALLGVQALAQKSEQDSLRIVSLEQKLVDLQNLVYELSKNMDACCSQTQNNEPARGAELFQNTPNPFSGSTTIRYYIPASAYQAAIQVTDLNGVSVFSKEISAKGEGNMVIDFSPVEQVYLCSLVINGSTVQVIKMVSNQ